MEAEFSLIDVFSDRPFGGNQLAVFPRAEGLSDEVMQQLAREFNFAESTFVLPSSDVGADNQCQLGRCFTGRRHANGPWPADLGSGRRAMILSSWA
jgi:PhzF family phenazine biosynthesis protein